jgi:DNA-binding MarR family transcriptional regulator
MGDRILELVSKIHLDWKRRVARELGPHDISPKQIFVLRRLGESGWLAPSDIAVLIHGDRPSATSLIDTLEREGWVLRRRNPENGRQVIVELSPGGRRKLASVPEALWRTGRTAFDPLACLDGEERAELARLLGKLHRWISAEEGR